MSAETISENKNEKQTNFEKKPELVSHRRTSDFFFLPLSIFIFIYQSRIFTQFPEVCKYLKPLGIETDYVSLWWIIPAIAFSWSLYYPIGKFLTRFWIYLLNEKSSRDGESKEQHIKRARIYLMGGIYYTLSVFITFYVGYHLEMLPKLFGGKLDFFDLIASWPTKTNDYLLFVYILSFGHHLERLIAHAFTSYSSATYFTMLLHHFIAVGLIAISYQSQYLEIGLGVLLCLDISDALLQYARFFRETKYRNFSYAIFAVMALTWIHGRICSFIFEIIIPVIRVVSNPTQFMQQFYEMHIYYAVSLSMLGVLNIFWLFQILKIAVTVFIKKSEKLEYEDHDAKIRKNKLH